MAHPVSYNSEKGTYQAKFGHVIGEFLTDFDGDEFVEYRIDEACDEDDMDEDAQLLRTSRNMIYSEFWQTVVLLPQGAGEIVFISISDGFRLNLTA